MVLRPDADTRMLDVSTLGATTNRIIERYGLPVPETYPKGDGPIASQPPIPAITPAPSIDPTAVDPASAQPTPSRGPLADPRAPSRTHATRAGHAVRPAMPSRRSCCPVVR